jgi:phosphatidate cytidylyltransferase
MSKSKSKDDEVSKTRHLGKEKDFFNDFSDEDLNGNKSESVLDIAKQEIIIKKNMLTRVKTGISIFGSFVLINMIGHSYCALFIFAIQVGMFREILDIKRYPVYEQKFPITTFILWYLFLVGSVFIFVGNFSEKLLLSENHILINIVSYRITVFFALYILGFIIFVLSLKINVIRYQIRLFIQTHLALLITLATSGAMVTLFEGQIWFIASAIAVILNDVFAYQVGVRYGKTKLIALSPQKTVEGFIGGLIGSLVVMRLVS